jgi:hypothetical protein
MKIFYSEEGVRRVEPRVYDESNPEEQAWGRRNYYESCYLSGKPELEPEEYAVRQDFYRAYRKDEDLKR